MRITSVKLKNFRCFGPEAVTISLSALTAFVGTNGCGKSSVLEALSRLFGISSTDRTVTREDFHVPLGKTLDEVGETALSIEVRLDFPELDVADGVGGDNEGAEAANLGTAVADCFAQMAVREEGASPYCRVRLEATWTPSALPEGEVEQSLVWLTTSSDEPKDADKQPVRAADRSRIQVLYVPAARDPVRQIRQVSGSLLHHILQAVRWPEQVKEQVEESSNQVIDQFSKVDGVATLQKALQTSWDALHPGRFYGDVSIRPTAKRFDELLKRVEAIFSPGPAGGEYPVERLSDGLKSLLYLAIISAAFEIFGTAIEAKPESDDEDENAKVSPFIRNELDPPVLMVFAIEEPENHLAPHYLGRIITLLRKMAVSPYGQALLTSHSASILSRVEPEEVRYLRLDSTKGTTLVREVTLPSEADAASTYVRLAVRAHPELYFARLVVLGEGDSEEIVLPRLAEAMGLPIDPSFVSIVPLAGRHVNHFWKLLSDLEIPHITLLDLDLERSGGGWGRVKYAYEQLLECGITRDDLLMAEDGSVLSDDELAGMHEWEVDRSTIDTWLPSLEGHNVFFSSPLDLDFMMLTSFKAAYMKNAKRGPSIPKDQKEYEDALASVLSAVLKDKHSGGKQYSADELRLFFWYRYLFLNRGKPVSHMMALADLSPEELVASAPNALKRLVERMKQQLDVAAEDEADAG
ncbi:ATP-dependent nuclease [Cystobacter ferrugineus]|uniref:ATP-dependent endonuclease n=1 Tax=Cystobacter ferrugineus TaxID=83449 RepID=A0A1L9BJY6_9BACT|nr:AAA family ATPase [Cystobacter ferrugineus]OJH42539.1 hypothetical protein BON30_04935 [Cystobacter ferrugineus]